MQRSQTQRSRIIAGVAFITLVAGAAVAQIRTEYSKTADFSNYKTFMWIKDPNTTNPLVNQRIVADINAALKSKGVQLVAADADLGVAANAATEKERTLQTFYDDFGGGWRWRDRFGSATTTVTTYTVGTLIVDIFDARTKDAIWRGTAMKTLSDDPHKRDESIDKGIAKLFESFPPNTTRSR